MKFTKLLPLVLCSALIFSSCDDDDNHVLEIPAIVETNLVKQYPETASTPVKWEKDNKYTTPYLKAEFEDKGVEVEVWYTYDGTWVKTETEFKDTLPLAITSILTANYPGFHIDDVVWVDTPTDSFFKVELEKGDNEIEISIMPDGTIIFINDNKNEVPTIVLQNFKELYPEGIIKEWEKEGSMLKAEFINGNVETEAWFNYNGEWVKTETTFKGKLPQEVSDYIRINFADFRIDEVKWVETPQFSFFEIELEKGDKEIKLSIHTDGTLISAKPDID